MNAQTKIEPATLSSAMALAFAEIDAATKSANNPHFKSKYADLSAIIEAVKPPLIKHGLFFTQRCHPAEDGVSVETVLHHSTGDQQSLGVLYVPANKRDAQGFGSALTYARRYGLMTAFGVPTEDDDGNAASRGQQASQAPANGNGNGRTGSGKDAPFPQGPAKGIMELKAMGRDLWRYVEACEDETQLDALIASHGPLVNQLRAGLPDWWSGGRDRQGETYEGLGTVISKKQDEFRLAGQTTVLHAG